MRTTEPKGGPHEGEKSLLLADHSGDVIALDATFDVSFFVMKNLHIRKKSGHIPDHLFNGHGISLTGPNWVRGFALLGVSIRDCEDGVHIIPQDQNNTGGIADVFIEKCAFNANKRVGFRCRGHIAIGRIEKCDITQNGEGGIWCGLKGSAIVNNDLEGQPSPLMLIGSASTDCVIENNYFEGNSGPPCITINTAQGFRVERNMYSNSPRNPFTMPLVLVANSGHGFVDRYAQLQGSHNIRMEVGGTVVDQLSATWNLSSHPLPAQAQDSAPSAVVFGGGGSLVTIGGVIHVADLVTNPGRGQYRVGTFDLVEDDYLFVTYAIKYTNDLPDANQAIVLGRRRSDNQFEKLNESKALSDLAKVGDFGFDPRENIKLGDTVVYLLGLKIARGMAYTDILVYVYPYGISPAAHSGAYVTRIVAWKQSSSEFSPVNPMVYLRELEASTPWTPGAVANAASVTTSVTITWARLGDLCQASFSLPLPRGVFMAAPQVIATDTVAVTLVNHSGTNQTIGAGALQVRILKR